MYARGDWQRPSWQGRTIMSSSASTSDDLFVACLLVERGGSSSSQDKEEACGLAQEEDQPGRTPSITIQRQIRVVRDALIAAQSILKKPPTNRQQRAATQRKEDLQ